MNLKRISAKQEVTTRAFRIMRDIDSGLIFERDLKRTYTNYLAAYLHLAIAMNWVRIASVIQRWFLTLEQRELESETQSREF